MRPRLIWTVFTVVTALVAAAMLWISHNALEIERTERRAHVRAEREESTRLALWRMDSLVAPLIARENARPYFTYGAFYPAERAYTRMFARIQKGDVLLPSPLLTGQSSRVLLHFQIAPGGDLSSPQVPRGNERDLAESAYIDWRDVEEAETRLARLARIVDRETMLSKLEAPPSEALVANTIAAAPPATAGQTADLAAQPGAQAFLGQNDAATQIEQQLQQRQSARNSAEWAARALTYLRTADAQKGAREGVSLEPGVREGAMRPLWVADALLLARRVDVQGATWIQGCWLDAAELRRQLLETAGDLVPGARLEPAPGGDRAEDVGGRRLASLPLRLVPDGLPSDPVGGWTPMRLSLVTAWACGFLAAVAVAALLQGVLTLSERRRVFVSAVTHELRTPLTTFRMYTEMLAEDMVRGEEKRREYLGRLSSEAERLGHLVENVLAFARLDSGRRKVVREAVDLRGWMRDVTSRLAERCERSDLTVRVEGPSPADRAPEPALAVRADTAALEQILLNLVDNACKYASEASGGEVRISLSARDGAARIRVSDDGPGISPRQRRRLFRPFSKSDREAAASAPGVGLGLALSRRLARSLGGDLWLDASAAKGASFVLEVPLAQ